VFPYLDEVSQYCSSIAWNIDCACLQSVLLNYHYPLPNRIAASKMTWVHNFNLRVAKSPFGRYFRLENSGHPKERKGSFFFTEIRAGLATFFASMKYANIIQPQHDANQIL